MDSYEVGDTATVSVSASDKFGTVKKIMWGCSSDGNIAYDSEEVFDPSLSSLDTDVTINLPNVETNSFECSFKAIDDDEEEGVASVTFTTNLPAQQTGGDDDNVNTPPTEPTEPTEPNGNVEPIVSPNTGAVMKDGRSAEEDIVMPIVVSAAVFVIIAVFATIFTLEKNQKL